MKRYLFLLLFLLISSFCISQKADTIQNLFSIEFIRDGWHYNPLYDTNHLKCINLQIEDSLKRYIERDINYFFCNMGKIYYRTAFIRNDNWLNLRIVGIEIQFVGILSKIVVRFYFEPQEDTSPLEEMEEETYIKIWEHILKEKISNIKGYYYIGKKRYDIKIQ